MSFFGSSKKDEGKEPPVAVAKVGGQIDMLVSTLLTSLKDNKESVADAVFKALKDIGDRHPEMVVSAGVNFLQTDTKASNSHRILVLKVLKAVVDDNRQKVSKSLAHATINVAFLEMTESKEIKAEWQTAASDLLVSLGIAHGAAVMDWVLKRMTAGEIPHYFVIKTLGDLAVADPVAVVPHLKEVFGRLVALLNLIKHDNIRWVFSFVIGRFCEGVIFFLANATPDQVAAAGINKFTFAGEVFTAYQIMFDNWLQRGESALRLVIMNAIGYMCETMAREQFEVQLPKIVTNILGMYKKEKKVLSVTQGLGLVLDVAVLDQNRCLEPMLQIVLQTLHQLVCIGPDSQDPSNFKNYSELLRCFEIICKTFSDNVVSFLLGRFESKEEKVRIGTLNIIKHIVNSAQSNLDDKKEMIISGLRPLLPETNLKVRKAFAQVVITLASRDYLGLEGGDLLVEFIVRQCAPTKAEEEAFNKLPKKDPDAVSPTALKTMCDNVLNLLTTTLPNVEKVLWPYLLEMIVPVLYTDALSVVTKSLAHIAAKKRAAEDTEYMIDFDKLVNLPKPQAIISRLLVVLSRPNERPQLGENTLSFFKAMGPVLHPSISDLWDDVVPKLATYLKDKSADPALWVQHKWEDLIIKLLAKTIDEINDDEWNTQLGEEMCKQFQLYAAYPQQKSMLFKCLGVVLQKSQKKALVRDKLDLMFNTVNHDVADDRDGCAAGYGACALTHLDIVLDKLATVINNDMKKKSSGFFGFSDKSDSDVDKIKCTVMLCYGQAASKADVALVKSRIEVTILNNILPFFPTARSALVKECIIKSVDLIGKTMHPAHLQTDYQSSKRKDLLQAMVKFVTTTAKGEVSNEVLTGSVNASATLAQLNPVLPVDEESELFSKTVGVIMRLPVAEAATADTMIGGVELIVQALLEKKCTSAVLDRFLKYFTAYIGDTDPVKRLRALNLVSIILQCYIDTAGSEEAEKEKNTDNIDLVKWVATIIPRCTDSQENIRALAVSCVGQLFAIKGMLAAVSESLAQKMAVIGERIIVTDTNAQFGVVHDLSRSLAPEITGAELFPFVEVLLQGLGDKEVSSASGTCIVLNGILRQRGAELGKQVSEIVNGIHAALKGITNEQTLNGALHSLRTLTGHHLILVADEFLRFPLPHDEQAVKALKTLAADAKIGPLITKHYMDLLATSQPYIEKPKTKKDYTKEATKITMALTCSLGEMFQVPEMEEVVRNVLPTMLGVLLLRVGATNGIEKGNAEGRETNKDAMITLKSLLTCIKDDEVLAYLNKDKNDELFNKPQYHAALMQLAAILFENYVEQMKDLVVFLSTYINTNFESQRITVAALFAEFIRHCKDQPDLLALMINPLIFRIGDPVQTMKLVVLEGLANVSETSEAEVNKYCTTILSALMSGMEDATAAPEMTRAALDGLSKIMAVVDPNSVVSILVNICLKLRGYFETQNDEIRASAITLFGALSRFGEGPSKTMFYEQIQTNMVTFILHLNESNPQVRKATKTTLKKLGPLLQANEINDLLQTLSEEKNLLYGEFLHALCKRMIQYYGKQVNSYLMECVNFFKSSWPENRANAAMFIGFLLGQIPKDMQRSLNVDHVCTALVQLIKDDDEKVRLRTAEAISFLAEY